MNQYTKRGTLRESAGPTIVDLWVQGVTVAQICARLREAGVKISEVHIRKIVNEARCVDPTLPPLVARKPHKVKLDDVVALWNSGKTSREISPILRISRSTVDIYLRRARLQGLSLRPSKRSVPPETEQYALRRKRRTYFRKLIRCTNMTLAERIAAANEAFPLPSRNRTECATSNA